MPCVNIRITREGAVSDQQKNALIEGATELLRTVLGKQPSATFVVIDEVELANWGVGGLPVAQFRQKAEAAEGTG